MSTLKTAGLGGSHRGRSATGPVRANGRVANTPASRMVLPGRCLPVERASVPGLGQKGRNQRPMGTALWLKWTSELPVIVTAGVLVTLDRIHQLKMFVLGSNPSSAASEEL